MSTFPFISFDVIGVAADTPTWMLRYAVSDSDTDIPSGRIGQCESAPTGDKVVAMEATDLFLISNVVVGIPWTCEVEWIVYFWWASALFLHMRPGYIAVSEWSKLPVETIYAIWDMKSVEDISSRRTYIINFLSHVNRCLLIIHTRVSVRGLLSVSIHGLHLVSASKIGYTVPLWVCTLKKLCGKF